MAKKQNEKLEKESKAPISKHGGARPGAGRKPGGQNQSTKEQLVKIEDARNYLDQAIREQLPEILQGQIELAKGIYVGSGSVAIDEETGEIISGAVYRKPPDVKAAKFLVDQLVGKAKQSVEVNGTLRTLVDVINDLENEETA